MAAHELRVGRLSINERRTRPALRKSRRNDARCNARLGSPKVAIDAAVVAVLRPAIDHRAEAALETERAQSARSATRRGRVPCL